MMATLVQLPGDQVNTTGTQISTQHRHGRAPARGATAHHRAKERTRLLLALGITVVIALLELVGGYLTNSLVLMSDAGPILPDISPLRLGPLLLHRSTHPP